MSTWEPQQAWKDGDRVTVAEGVASAMGLKPGEYIVHIPEVKMDDPWGWSASTEVWNSNHLSASALDTYTGPYTSVGKRTRRQRISDWYWNLRWTYSPRRWLAGRVLQHVYRVERVLEKWI